MAVDVKLRLKFFCSSRSRAEKRRVLIFTTIKRSPSSSSDAEAGDWEIRSRIKKYLHKQPLDEQRAIAVAQHRFFLEREMWTIACNKSANSTSHKNRICRKSSALATTTITLPLPTMPLPRARRALQLRRRLRSRELPPARATRHTKRRRNCRTKSAINSKLCKHCEQHKICIQTLLERSRPARSLFAQISFNDGAQKKNALNPVCRASLNIFTCGSTPALNNVAGAAVSPSSHASLSTPQSDAHSCQTAASLCSGCNAKAGEWRLRRRRSSRRSAVAQKATEKNDLCASETMAAAAFSHVARALTVASRKNLSPTLSVCCSFLVARQAVMAPINPHHDAQHAANHACNVAENARWLILMEQVDALHISVILGAKTRIFRTDDALAAVLGYDCTNKLFGTPIHAVVPSLKVRSLFAACKSLL